MSQFSKVLCSTALIYAISAPVSFADVTNNDVWGNWKSYMEDMGYSVTATQSTAGDTLSLSDIKMSMTPVQGIEAMSISMPLLEMTENGDGTVRLSIPPLSELVLQVSPEDGEAVEVKISYAQDGLDMVASGTANALDYAYSATSITASLAGINVDGTDIGNDLARATVKVADVQGNTLITTGDTRTSVQTTQTGPLTYDLAFNDPDSNDGMTTKGGVQRISSNSTYTIPTGGNFNMQDMNTMLDAGFAVDATMSYQGGNMDLSFSGPDGAGTMQSSTETGMFNVAMSADGVKYDVGSTGMTMNALIPDVPLPISMSMAESRFNFAMPIQKSNEEQDFALGFTMGNFIVSDLLWGMFDPSGQLPRDPATIALDLTGKAKVLFDFLDPAQAAALGSSGAAPGELNAMTLKNLVIDAVGARLSGSGDFTFDNSDLATFDGMPKPTGAVNLKLTGGNGLIDKLVAMNMLPEEQAMGARMMMGLFAVATEGEDTLNSKIEINDQGAHLGQWSAYPVGSLALLGLTSTTA